MTANGLWNGIERIEDLTAFVMDLDRALEGAQRELREIAAGLVDVRQDNPGGQRFQAKRKASRASADLRENGAAVMSRLVS